MLEPLLIIFIAIALLYGFLTGIQTSANVVASAIASRAMSPRIALTISALANFIGPFLFGVAVAETIGTEVVSEEAVTVPTALAALLAAIFWNFLTWWFGIPSSSSHAFIGGFVGSAVMGYGINAVQLPGLIRVLLALFISPFLGFGFAYLLMVFFLWVGRYLSPSVNQFFLRSQWITMISLGLSHGTNNAQKVMGILTFGLVAYGILPEFVVTDWVIFISAGVLALGTALGGWRVIRTIGAGFYRIRAVHAFSSQISSSVVILGAALLGGPVSTTHVISSSIVGAGSAERVNMIRWGLATQISMAWLVTIPVNFLLGAIFYYLLVTIL
ncbi:MAG: anion permease [Anaerolineales bacterium]